MSMKIDGDKAVVVAEAKIRTAGAEAIQKEVYYLICSRGKWLANELEVLEGNVKQSVERFDN